MCIRDRVSTQSTGADPPSPMYAQYPGYSRPAHQAPPMASYRPAHAPRHQPPHMATNWRLGRALSAANQNPCGSNQAVEFLKLLGEGVFGEVWTARYKGARAAVKVTGNPAGFRGEELELLQRAQGGSHCVWLIALEKLTPKGTAIVTELCDGNLEEVVVRAGGFDGCPDLFVGCMEQILEGLVELHSKDIIFGDLKPDNLLIRDGKVVFCDFGDARDARRSYRGLSVHDLGWGSPEYHARPDVMRQDITFKSDLWMAAMTAIHLWTGSPPRCNPPSSLPPEMPMEAMLTRCVSVTPRERPTAAEALDCCRQAAAERAAEHQTGLSSTAEGSKFDASRHPVAVLRQHMEAARRGDLVQAVAQAANDPERREPDLAMQLCKLQLIKQALAVAKYEASLGQAVGDLMSTIDEPPKQSEPTTSKPWRASTLLKQLGESGNNAGSYAARQVDRDDHLLRARMP
eukprot:TRINITY_DN2023_c0_g2_i2.p1 TRINITY_DN2023_c0_g2~~TRINITY_DN2023_c0_g2_i2.p1  ORF type:complete len:459 (-),score=96.03 TRINITY_DN2023_c0_g2_i2:982-2358(-)